MNGNESAEAAYGSEVVMEPQAETGGMSRDEMMQFVLSSMNGDKQLPYVAILRPNGRKLMRMGEEGSKESAFVWMDVGVLNEEGGYDVRNVRVPWENYAWTALDGKIYNKLTDYVCGEVLGKSDNELYGTNTLIKVFGL